MSIVVEYTDFKYDHFLFYFVMQQFTQKPIFITFFYHFFTTFFSFKHRPKLVFSLPLDGGSWLQTVEVGRKV